MTDLVARLEAPLMAAGTHGAKGTVWHCSLSVRADERPITDAEWQEMAGKFVDRMGFGPSGDQAGCRWVAVHHGPSKEGNDHIHLVVTMATEDGRKVYPYRDFPRAQQVCGELEREHCLQALSPARDGATSRPETTRAEVERARRAGQPATDREIVRRTVRASLAAASDEADWIARMKAAGLLVKPRTARENPRRVVGYSVAAKPAVGKPVWFGGRTLDRDLSLAQVRRRWPGAADADLMGWKQPARPIRTEMTSEERVQVWTASAQTIGSIRDGLRTAPPPPEQLHAVARSAADTLAQIATVAEPEGGGPVSRSADALARAGAPPRGQRRLPRGEISNRLTGVAGALALTGAARTGPEIAGLLAVIVAATRLAQAIAELRQAQQAAAAAAQARTAAERMMPVLQRAMDAGVRVPGRVDGGRASDREHPQPTPAAPQRRRAGPLADRGPER
ncbi:relaxase [Micromonospora sp. WMMA1363]|uniref:relaxase/mobilization nuclease domain-containing protein n=1 Tax=Micromonospora sp. WMMA1363 TaxID=3053985 RepID=UPI00259CE2BC|nr:relaxase [Micromonospora sp. WMMA1363]MDM4723494.1 relaxase [Micromonospora sp. WMMA1363]